MAKAKPEAPAILSADGSSTVTWSEFDRITTALAREWLRLGFAKGDFLVTLLPLSVDHVLLEYSCFKIGVIVAPLDLRLSPSEVIRALEILRPRGFVGLGLKGPFDFRELWRAVQAHCPWIEHCIAVDSDTPISGTQSFASIAEPARRTLTNANPETVANPVALAGTTLTENDGVSLDQEKRAMTTFLPSRFWVFLVLAAVPAVSGVRKQTLNGSIAKILATTATRA